MKIQVAYALTRMTGAGVIKDALFDGFAAYDVSNRYPMRAQDMLHRYRNDFDIWGCWTSTEHCKLFGTLRRFTRCVN